MTYDWLTCDTGEPIRAGEERTVYLLQPHGLPPIREDAYKGDGVFGSMNAHVWLGIMNVNHPEQHDKEWKRYVGEAMEIAFRYPSRDATVYPPNVPLKFSFNRDAVYEDHPPSGIDKG